MAASTYDASSITVLEGLEAVRKRPGMYIGSTGERGLHHLVYEIADNAIDEHLAGHAASVHVTLLADGGVRVVDDGRGIPTGIIKKEGRSAAEVVFTVLHAGGKFDGESYAVSGGLHGVGSAVVNALSSRLEVEIHNDGAVWRQTYSKSKPVAPLAQGEATDRTGTIVTFWADDTIFETTSYSFETLARRFQETAFLNAGLTITLRDERRTVTADDGTETYEPFEQVWHYPDGITDFVRHLNASKSAIHPSIVSFSKEEPGMSVDIALQWNEGYSESVYTFANIINTPEGGTHEEGFRTALTTTIKSVAREKGWIKPEGKAGSKADKDELTGEDIREGLTAIVSIKLAEPQFEGQTKQKLGNTSAKTFVQKVASEALTEWLIRNPGEGKTIVQKAQQASRARLAARQARELTRRKGLMSGSGLPGKLRDCQSGDPGECEVFVVEGDSAGGCFAAETLVATVEGRAIRLDELAADAAEGIQHFGYASDAQGDVVVVPLVAPRLTKQDAALVEVTLDDGSSVRCTPDHRFRLRDGSYRRADQLQPDDSLMPLNRRLSEKDERGRRIAAGYELAWANGGQRWVPTHHLADARNLLNGDDDVANGNVRHHLDWDKRNNDPRNIMRMRSADHIALHAAHAQKTLGPLWLDPEYRARKLASLSENAKKQWQDPEFRALKSEQVRAQRHDFAMNAAVMAGFERWWQGLDSGTRAEVEQRLNEAQKTYWASEEHRAEAAARVTAWFQAHPEAREHLRKAANIQWSVEWLRDYRSSATRAWWDSAPGLRERHSAKVRAWAEAHPEKAQEQSDLARSQWRDPDFREAVATGLKAWRAETPSSVKGDLIRAGNERAALRLLADCLSDSTLELRLGYELKRRTVGERTLRWDTLLQRFDGDVAALHEAASLQNHRVASVVHLEERADVYDLTVEDHHNFALECGVFVHNSAAQGRNPYNQAILPIRGKILNVEKARLDKILKNTEVQALITAFGTGISEDFDIAKLRYHKIVLMADADVDGQHITTLLLTLLFRFMKPLIEAGHVYLAQPPLYKLKWTRAEAEYAYSDRERDAKSEAGIAAGKKLPKEDGVQRFKGLGEMNAAELRDTTMDPDQRLLRQVTLDDGATADELFSILMGDDVEARRGFIQRNARDVRFLDI